MLATALPVRIGPDGKLLQEDAFDAVLRIIAVMAGTTPTTWPHAPWFGLLEAFGEASRRERQDHENLRDAINLALRELGVADIRVQSVTTGSMDGGRRPFQLTLVDQRGDARFGQVTTG
ncbi:MAG: hypothetical protein AB7L66_17615 [Gemmatimonadales bacterium]